MSDAHFNLFADVEAYAVHSAKSIIFDTIHNIYERDYLPIAKDVYEWVITHDKEYQNHILDLVEQLAPKHLGNGEFDADFTKLKQEVTDTFEWLHDKVLGK